MVGTVKKCLISASVAVGMSAIATAPASAFSITGNNDYLLYGVCEPNFTCLKPDADLNNILAGNSSSPGGNIELFASSESVDNAAFLQSNARTSIVGTVAGKSLTVSSLTATDWFGPSLDIVYGADTFATKWFDEFYDKAGLADNEAAIKAQIPELSLLPSWLLRTAAYNAFFNIRGFQRSSDPNISYITTSGSDLLIGLSGQYDAKAFYAPQLGNYAKFIKDGFQVSETVKVNYGGIEKLLYSFSATESGLINGAGPGADGKSHTGNYEVSIKGVVTSPPTKDVPEPSAILALIGLGGFLAAKRKHLQKA